MMKRLRNLTMGTLGHDSPEPIRRPGGSPTVVAFHGFGSSPGEMRLVADVARGFGLGARVPLLPGHGATVGHLARTRWADWRAAAEAELSRAIEEQGPVIVVGMSMGALLACEVVAARQSADVVGLVCLAPAVRLHFPFPALALAALCGLRVPDFAVPKRGPDIRDARQRRQHLTVAAQPVYAANEVRKAGPRILDAAKQIVCPTLIMHALQDHVCPPSGARELLERLGTPAAQKQLVLLPRSYHIVTRDLERGLVRRSLQAFLATLLKSASQGAAGGRSVDRAEATGRAEAAVPAVTEP